MRTLFAKSVKQLNFCSPLRGLGSFLLLVVLCSWGYKGHQTIGYIAQRHLTPRASAAVKQLLGTQSLADVSTWADEVSHQPDWRYTAPWHFVNVPPGLNRQQFINAVKSSPQGNLLQGLNKCEAEIIDPAVSGGQKIIDLKFIIHLAGDAHQPMHVSRAEDKGGNKIQVRFNGQGTNLHALWDSKLLDEQGLDNTEFAAKYDVQTPAHVAQWQSTSPLDWMYESYLISTRLYAETATDRDLSNMYYNQHIALADKRLEIAGIRLAGLLNRLFKNGITLKGPIAEQAGSAPIKYAAKPVNAADLTNHYNQVIAVKIKIFGQKHVPGMTLVDAGGNYPNQLLTIVLKGGAQSLSRQIDGKTVQVTGTLMRYHNKPEIIVSKPANLVIR